LQPAKEETAGFERAGKKKEKINLREKKRFVPLQSQNEGALKSEKPEAIFGLKKVERLIT
jgi:hypothetical protein